MGDKTDLEKLNEGIDGFNNNQLNMIRVLQAEIGKDIADFRTEFTVESGKTRYENIKMFSELSNKISQTETKMTDKVNQILIAQVALLIAILVAIVFK